MNKVKLGSLIFIISITGLSSTGLAKEQSNEPVGSTIIDTLSFEATNFSKLNKLYPEIKIANLTSDITLSEKEEIVAGQVKKFIDNTSFEQVIDVFSDSLYEDIPANDYFEGQTYEMTDLKEVYENKIKKESTMYAKLIVSVNQLEEYNQETVKQQLVLVSYFNRWGSFSNGKHMFWNELYHPQSNFMTKEQATQLNAAFVQLFSENPEQNLASKNVSITFWLALQAIDRNEAYKECVEHFLVQNGITDYSQWFYDSFKGRIYKDHYEGSNYDVGIWNRGATFYTFVPYLLNQTDTSNLMIGETRGEIVFTSPYNYGNDFVQAEKVLANAMKTITNTLELYDRTIVETDEMDVDKVLGQRAVLDQGRQWLNPEDSLSYELYRVAGYTGSHPNNGAVGGAGRIQMQANKLNVYATIAHELGHELDSLFNANIEFYTTYIDNAIRQQASYVNTFADGISVVKQNNAISNTSVENFQTKEDLTNYVTNMEDMAYLLDGIVATKVLALPVEEQVNYIKIAYVDGIKGSLNTEIDNADTIQARDLTLEELKALNLQTIEDLIDHNAVIMQPSDSNLNILRNKGQGYGTTMTYSAFFLSNGKPYHHNHRIINTLLAENGWEAFKTFNVTYNSAYSANANNGLSTDERVGDASLQALRAAFNDETVTYRSLMKQRYAEVMLRFKEGGLLDRSYQEMMDSMSSMDLANFYTFKQQNMSYYLNLSDEFSRSAIGYDEQIFVSVGSYTELYEVIKKNSSAQIKLTQSFKVEGQYAHEELPAFSGSLNGSGYTISELNQALFSSITGAEVKNLVLRDIKIDEKIATNEGENSYSGGLANIAQNTRIQNVHVVDASIFSTAAEKPIVGGIIGNSLNTVIQNSTVQDTIVSGAYVGGIAGRSENSKLLNVYTTGQLKGIPISDLRIGGIIGNGFKNTVVQNSYTTMEVEKGNGMLGSDYTSGNKSITFENSISLAKIETANQTKFYGYGVSLVPWKNNFEIEEYTGKSSTTFENLDVSSVSLKQVNQEFFANQLSWKNETVWGIENTTSENKLPYLKNSDPRNKEEKDLSKLILKTERKEIYVGEELDLEDLIDEVYDKTGQLVDKKEVEIIGTVDNSKSGETVIVYKYNNIEKKAIVVVKENKTSVKVHDSTIYVGDTWEAKDNFDGATDREGKEVGFEKITVGGDTVDTTKTGRYEVRYSYEDVESKAVVTVKESQTTAFEKETKITFLEDNDTGTIIDPEDPGNGVTPVDPVNPNGAELMISYASNLNFGVHKSKTGTSFNALADKVWADETQTETREVTPFVATKDSRGVSREGWVLTARQENEFVGENKQPLKGAELSLSNLSYANLVGAPTATANKIVLGQEAKEVAKAGMNQGIGAWSLAMGQLDSSVEQGEDKVMSKTTSGITLSLPANTVIDTQTYSTTVTWELATDPTL
ncbi:WxL domain-containing protein [Enterococcus faecalis]|uniref:WxL domain-containing protein n=1 Tax=Enterococcus faecalis TaxID=1351 RepID=UPI002DBDC2E5|nr:WxL domain-containing protein [Enterococcus faecalis]MEB7428076.1 WxL domain-containing protein [Enterococcus faecalis]